MNTAAPAPGPLGRVARAVSGLMLAYWGAFALASPVMTIDSQMYNVARLELALRDGLFGNDHFTSLYHVIFPWTFDAVHLPFLRLGWGCALPSFLCLAGLCHITWTLVRARFGADAAWLAVLSLLALPCLVYQAASTKNDLALVFCGATWLYARWRHRREGGTTHVVWMVLAIGLMAGTKSTGLLFATVLSAWTLWELRGNRPLALRAAAGLTAAGLLFGSVETYVESARLFGHPLGPPAFVHRISNHDGLPGGAANLIRHVAGGIYVGQTDYREGQQPVTAWSEAVGTLLTHLHLANHGVSPLFPDERLFFAQSGMEELSGFGPLGTATVLILLAAAVWWHPRERWWQLGAGALLVFVVISLTVAYTAWTRRYLLGGYALGTVAWVCLLWERDAKASSVLRIGTLVLAAAFALTAPLLSFNRGPASLLAAFTDRESLETSSYPIVGETRRALRELHTAEPDRHIFVVVNDESVILPLLRDRALDVVTVTAPVFARLLREGGIAPGDFVVHESQADSPDLVLVREVTAPNVYSLDGTLHRYIYRVARPAPDARPAG